MRGMIRGGGTGSRREGRIDTEVHGGVTGWVLWSRERRRNGGELRRSMTVSSLTTNMSNRY